MTGSRKRLAAAVAVAACVLTAGPGAAQVFFLYPEAPVVGEREPAAGIAFGAGEQSLFRLIGYGRFNLAARADLGLELVFDRSKPGGVGDSRSRYGLAADAKYGIVPASRELPFDLSVGAGLGFQLGGDLTTIEFPFGAVVSRPLELGGGRQMVPYGGFYFVYRHASFDGGPSNDEVDPELRLGLSLQVFKTGAGFASLHIAEVVIFYIGFNGQV